LKIQLTNVVTNRFFCAIEPEMRPAWGKSMHELLKPDGELITLMYPVIISYFCRENVPYTNSMIYKYMN